MKFNNVAAAAAMLAGVAYADEAEPASKAAAELPTFTVSVESSKRGLHIISALHWPNQSLSLASNC